MVNFLKAGVAVSLFAVALLTISPSPQSNSDGLSPPHYLALQYEHSHQQSNHFIA